MPGQILSGSTLAAGLRDDFQATYDPAWDGVQASLDDAMQFDVPFNHRTETFGMHETMPYPERFDEGNEAIPMEGTGSKSFSVTVYDYGKRINWRKKDREDNRIGDLRGRASALGSHFASLDTRIFIELLTAAPSLLPANPNAPDGAALYSATDGASADRFGISGGNIETGTGVATSGAVETDFFSAISTMGTFQDIKGEPYWEPSVLTERYTIFFGIANIKIFTQAFMANAVMARIAGTSTTDTSTAAGVSNVVLASGVQVTLRPTARITDNDWFVFRGDAPIKPVFSGVRRPLTEAEATEDNSDEARTTGKEYVQWTCRKAYGVNVPFATVKVNN